MTLLWAAAIGKLPALRRDRHNPARWAYWLALVSLALALTVLRPPWATSVGSTTDVRTPARLLGHSLVLAAACAVQVFLAYSVDATARAWPRMRRRALTLAVILALLASLFALGRSQRQTLDFAVPHQTSVPTLLYWLIFLGYLTWALVDLVRLNWRWATLTDHAVLRLGLRLTAAGALFGLGYVACTLLFVVATQLGRTTAGIDQILPLQLLLTMCVLLIVIGTTMPAWGPRIGLPRLLRWIGYYRAHRRLYPLWRDLCQAVPGIALVVPSSPLRDAVTVSRLGFRLHRRVIEIRDARLALRPYLDPSVADTATELGRRAGLDGDDLRAVVEATSLAAAVQAKAQGRPATGARTVTAVGGADLESESGWLVKVATAYTHSPLVRTMLIGDQPQPHATVRRQPTARRR